MHASRNNDKGAAHRRRAEGTPHAPAWLGIEVRHLAALRAIAECSSFTGAATSLGYTQSAVSQQIATLERIVGTELVVRPRGSQPLQLTKVGRLLLRHAATVTVAIAEARDEVASLNRELGSTLSVGVHASTGATIVADAMARIRRDSVSAVVRLVECGDDEETLRRVAASELDFAIVHAPIDAASLEVQLLLEDPYVVLVKRNSPLARVRPAPTLAAVLAMPLIMFDRAADAPYMREHLEVATSTPPNVVFTSDDPSALLRAIEADAGVGVVPELPFQPLPPSLTPLQLDSPLPARTLALVSRRSRGQARVRRDVAVAIAEAFAAHAGWRPDVRRASA